MVQIDLPSFELLAKCQGQTQLLMEAICNRGLHEWKNAYLTKCPEMPLLPLLSTRVGLSFVEEVWGWHLKSGTPELKREQNVKKGEQPTMLPNTPRIELLQHTAAIVFDMARALQLPVEVPTTLETELPDGEYLYLIEVVDSPVFKLGHVVIRKATHATHGTPTGRRCIMHRYFDLGRRDKPPPGKHFTGEWCKERLSLRHFVKGSFRDEHCVHGKLRALAKEFQCLEGEPNEEFHDVRLISSAIREMNSLGNGLQLDAPAAAPSPVAAPVAEPVAAPVVGAPQERTTVSKNLKYKLQKELTTGKTGDRKHPLSSSQITRKNCLLREYFEAR